MFITVKRTTGNGSNVSGYMLKLGSRNAAHGLSVNSTDHCKNTVLFQFDAVVYYPLRHMVLRNITHKLNDSVLLTIHRKEYGGGVW